jgi:hypothetical protein
MSVKVEYEVIVRSGDTQTSIWYDFEENAIEAAKVFRRAVSNRKNDLPISVGYGNGTVLVDEFIGITRHYTESVEISDEIDWEE